MKETFEKIWELALPYQDKRDDVGHALITTNYAKLLLSTELGNEDIVIPAIMLHDVGWSKLAKEESMRIFDKNLTDIEELKIRVKHQDEGVKIANEILTKLNYSPYLIKDILEIISQHDTRRGFISCDEGLVRDADKLWRFSKVGFVADLVRFNIDFEELYSKRSSDINHKDFFYSNRAKKIALDELGLRKKEFEQDVLLN